MNLTEYIGQYEKIENQNIEVFSAFYDRLTRARKLIQGRSYEERDRSIKSPFYLTDLGVRRLESPALYAKMISQEFDVQLPSSNEVETELMGVNIKDLVHWLDIMMLLIGDYELAARICLKRKAEILDSHDFQLHLFAGTSLAAISNEDYHLFFENAKYQENLDFEDRIVSYHRLAVSELKRSHDFKEFDKIVVEVLSNYDMDNFSEFVVVLGLLNNLSGLEQVEQKSSNTILRLTMVNADILLNVALTTEKDSRRYDMILRYLGQVAINRSQIEMFDGNWEAAISILKSSLKRNLENHSDYSGENFGILSVMEYRNNQYEEAREHSKEAIGIYKSIGDVVAAEQAYKVLIGANDKLGNHELAEELALKLKSMDRSLFI
jgi:tetratricopeptide (TPR) repeat protein